MASFGAVEWMLLAEQTVQVGDVVSADAGGMPIYQVVAVEDGQAWLRDNDQHPAFQTPLSRFRWKAAAVHS